MSSGRDRRIHFLREAGFLVPADPARNPPVEWKINKNKPMKYLQDFQAKYPKLVSAMHTFAAAFVVAFLSELALIPADKVLSPATWTVAAVVSLLGVAVRSGIKSVSPFTSEQ